MTDVATAPMIIWLTWCLLRAGFLTIFGHYCTFSIHHFAWYVHILSGKELIDGWTDRWKDGWIDALLRYVAEEPGAAIFSSVVASSLTKDRSRVNQVPWTVITASVFHNSSSHTFSPITVALSTLTLSSALGLPLANGTVTNVMGTEA